MDPQILTPPNYDSFLSESAMNADRLELMVVRAENKVIDRYRETRPDDRIEDYFGGSIEGHMVQLDGWIESDDGTLDLQQADDELLFALRDAVARIVEFWVDKPDEAEHIARKDQGDRRVDFRDKDLPSSVYAPLHRFDERDVWHGG